MPDKYITLWVVKQVRHTKKGLVILNQSSVLSKKDYSLFPQLYKDKVKIFLNPKDIYLMKHWFSVSNYRVIAVLYFSVAWPNLLNPIDTGIFFDACVPGGCEKSHPPQNQFCFYKTTFFLHEVKFCINSVLFLCTVLFSSSILMNFSDFG